MSEGARGLCFFRDIELAGERPIFGRGVWESRKKNCNEEDGLGSVGTLSFHGHSDWWGVGNKDLKY